MSGAVLNVAVMVDDQYPISCVSRWTGTGNLRIVTVLNQPEEGSVDLLKTIEFSTVKEIIDVFNANKQQWHSLVIAVLIVLGIVDARADVSEDMAVSQHLVTSFSQDSSLCGIEIAFKSNLPPGNRI